MLNKFDDVIDLCRSHDVVCIAESWHDSDSAVLGRLRASGYFVVDRPRPRQRDSMGVNHGGVVAASRFPLAVITIAQRPTFEMLCFRVVVGRESVVMAVIYRPPSAAVGQEFFDDFSCLLEQLATQHARTFVVGDFNIRLDRPDHSDVGAKNFRQLAECAGYDVGPLSPTHRLGSIIDAVLSQPILGSRIPINVADIGLSDHYLLEWSVDLARPTDVATEVQSRAWGRLDKAAFRAALADSALCRPEEWPSNLDQLAVLYDDVIGSILDDMIPIRQFRRIRRPTDPWFDGECRAAVCG
jgi:hypothetical protein